MSGEPKSEATEPAVPRPEDSGPIPVEVETAGAGAVAAEPEAAAPAAPAKTPFQELEEKLTAAQQDIKDAKDRHLRAAADLDNMRKRTRREIEDAKFETKNKVLKEMLPVVDNLERAIEHAGGDGEKNAIVEGVQLVLRQFQTAFERLEVTPIEALGQPFDPNQHEAISQAESDAAPGTIVQVLQRGYRAGDRLLRPALVVVAKAKAAAE